MKSVYRTVISTLVVFSVVVFGITVAMSTRADAQQDLLLHLTFDDPDDLAADSSGNDIFTEIDDLELFPLEDAQRGNVLELGGGAAENGFIRAEIGELPGDNFTIAFWAYRDFDLAGDMATGGNDGFFQVQPDLGGFGPSGGPADKVIGGWVQKSDSAVWGRLHDDAGVRLNLDSGTYFMPDDEWVHFAYRGDGNVFEILVNGESGVGPEAFYDGTLLPHDLMFVGRQGGETWGGRLDDFQVYTRALTDQEIRDVMEGLDDVVRLEAGDADQNLDFNQLDIVKVSVANKYLSGQAATWGEGDWDGAPGGEPGSPPPGDGFFDQVDIIAALTSGKYLTGPYAALAPGGSENDEQTSLVYYADSGRLDVDAPASTQLTSIFVTSAGNLFVGDKPPVLDGPFDSFGPDNIFKSTIGSSFGDSSFGAVLPAGLTQEQVASDLSASGSLDGGGGLGDVDLVYVPEPSSLALLVISLVSTALITVRGGYRYRIKPL